MNTVTIKKIDAMGFGMIGRKHVWVVILEGSIFGEYATKKAAIEDAKKYGLKVAK